LEPTVLNVDEEDEDEDEQ